MTDVTINGYCDEKFASVHEAFEKNFRLGLEHGASFTVMVDEEPVVDLWAGFKDGETETPWEGDTIVPVASSTKVPLLLCAHLLLDRGQLDLDTPVADYWPEFAQRGKQEVTVRHVLTHSSGLAGFDAPFTWNDQYDVPNSVRQLESQAPWWQPGTQSGYHSATIGVLIGELIQRITGQSYADFFRAELSGLTGTDFFVGTPESEHPRIASVSLAGSRRATFSPISRRVNFDNDWPIEELGSMRFRTAVLPAASGIGNSRGLTRVGTALAKGEWQGRRYLSAGAIEAIYQEQIYTFDLVMGAPVRWGLGFGIVSKEVPIPFDNCFHWGGAGGSIVVMEPDRRASWSYTPNLWEMADATGDERGTRVSAATIRSLQAI